MNLRARLRQLLRFLRLNGYGNPLPPGAGPWRKILATPRKAGRAGAVIIGILCDRHYDRKHGVSTSGAVLLEDLEIECESVACGVLYDAFPRRSFHRLIHLLPEASLSDFTFVDFGSGKGKVLLVAAEHPFRAVAGVEFAPELHRDAVANIRIFSGGNRRCTSIRSELCDATLYDLPDGGCVLFFFYPFGGEVLAKVMANIDASLRGRPRKVYLIFVTDPETHPMPRTTLDGVGSMKMIQQGRLPYDVGMRYPLEFIILASLVERRDASELSSGSY